MRSSPNRALLAVGLWVGVAAATETARIMVAADVPVRDDTVRLRDVATLDGAAAEALGGVTLGRAGNAGESRTFDGGFVLGTLRRAGLDPSTVTYSIPPLVRVRRAGQALDAAALRPLVERWLDGALGAGARDAELRELTVASPITVPLGAWDGRVVSAPRTAISGPVRLQLEITAEGQPARTLWVTADVTRWVPVVVARRAVERGETLGRSDLDVDRRELATLPADVATNLAEVVGTTVRAAIVPYTPLRRDQVAALPVVRRGDAVRLVAQHSGLQLSAAGEVRQDARRGERVRVINRASQREVLGRVLDANTVEVTF